MMRWLTTLLALLCLTLPLRAGAVAYTFPGAMPTGCTGSNGNYSCPGGTALGYGDTITINSPKPATITVNGNFSTNTSQINLAGAASDLNLVVNGTLTLGYQASIKANITANAVNDAGGGTVAITGNLSANSNGNISLAYRTTVSGNVTTSGTGTISTPHNGSIGGNVVGGSGSITISEGSTIGGSVSGSGSISVGQDAIVSGNVSAGAGALDLGYQSRVSGNLSTSGAITLGQSSHVGGNITGGSGAVSVGYGATVAGTLTTSSGSITFAQSASASSCVKSTGSASITLGYQASVNSVCCGSSTCSSSCVTNNSTYAMPHLCSSSAPSLLADYRMDETTLWTGAAGEVKDSSTNARHAQAATAAAGTPTATVTSGSPAYGTTTAGSCGYGVFNRASPSTTHAYVQLPSSFPSMNSSFTVVAWIRSSKPNQQMQRIIANDDAQDGWALTLGDSGGNRLRLYHRNLDRSGSVTTGGSMGTGATTGNCNTGGYLCLDSAAIFNADTWYYVAALVDTANKTVSTQIYDTDGTLLASASTAYTGTWTAGSGGTTLGGESISSTEGSSTAHFNGNIDELQVYSGLLSNSAIAAQLGRSRNCPGVASFAISGTGSASSCTPQTLTLVARDALGNTLTGYTGTVKLSTSTGRGDWTVGASPTPSGTLVAGAANSGLASYTFAAGDAGVVKLRLAHSLAQNLTVTVVDSNVASSSSSSAALNYRDNAFVWTEDSGNLVSGSFVAVAGRSHDMRVSLWKKDPTTGNCSVATDYSGSRALKLWRTDNGGSWSTPSVVSPALSPVPTARPASNNLTLSFTAGVANFNLATTNVGKYAFNLDDDSLAYAATTVSGTSADLTVRPFTLAVTGLTASATANPGGSLVTDSVFAKAGASFSATVTAYRWASGADANNDGVPDAGASFAQISAGGAASGFSASVSLTAVAGSQTPSTGVLGSLSNNVLSSFSSGTATATDITYSEVGSFLLNTSSVVGNYLGTSGLNLDALVFNAAGSQQARIGRFIPASFALSNPSATHRVGLTCSVASTFTYLDENFTLGFTLTAQNASGVRTQNYAGNFARLDLGTAANFNLAGIAGTTMFKTTNGRLALTGVAHSGWSAGLASGIALTARALRTSTADGPFNASFGIAPTDADGVTINALDLDTDSPVNGADRSTVGAIPLRFGRLRLQNGIGPANRQLKLALDAQYWNGAAYNTNTLDSCTSVSATHLSFGNLRRTLVASDVSMVGTSATVSSGKGSITLAAPASGHVGSVDVAIALDSATPPTDASCLKSQAGWTPTKSATAGAGLSALRGPWCGTAYSDPGARAIWGVYRGADGVVYQRENY